MQLGHMWQACYKTLRVEHCRDGPEQTSSSATLPSVLRSTCEWGRGRRRGEKRERMGEEGEEGREGERMERKGEKGRGKERNGGGEEEWGRKRRRGRGRKWKRCRVRTTKEAVRSADVAQRLKHSQNLPNQGELDQLMERDAATLWPETMHAEALKFALNVSQDTLPGHTMWTCAIREARVFPVTAWERQTLAHILNHSQVALDLRRYNVRHDAVLEVIDKFVRENCLPDVEAITDLPAYDYTFQACIAPTDLWPDVCAMELNSEICHSCGAASACATKPTLKMHTLPQKVNKYKDLAEAGSSKNRHCFLQDVSRKVILRSHCIWTLRNSLI